MGFLENYKNLLHTSPKLCLTQWNCENSAYTLFVNHSKNSYLCRGSGWMEDCYYLYWVYHATDTADCVYCENVELCYECVDCMRCYNCNFCQECRDSRDLILCYDCTGCKNCFGCVGLIQKEFYFLNEKTPPEEYKKLTENKLSPEILQKYGKLKETLPHRDFILKCENCIGNHIENSQKCFYCFDMVRSRDCFYNFNAYENIDSIDCSFTKAEFGYENVGGGWNFNCDYILFCKNCSDSKVLFQCQDCKHCFGCDGLHHKEYYILNKPYSKEEWEERTAQIWNELRNTREAGNLMSVFQDEEFQGIIH